MIKNLTECPLKWYTRYKQGKPVLVEYPHCDTYIDDDEAPEALRRYLSIKRLPAQDKFLAYAQSGVPKLFARWEGKAVRVVMASRFGDVGISYNLQSERGYFARVMVAELTDFTDRELCTKPRRNG